MWHGNTNGMCPCSTRYAKHTMSRITWATLIMVSITLVLQITSLVRQYHPGGRGGPPPVRNPSQKTWIDLAQLPTRGDQTARVVLVEFSDYECPFCARHATTVGRQIQETFAGKGIRFAFANFPLPMHPNAKAFATGAICAGQQGHYWEMHDSLFAQKPKDEKEMAQLAATLPLDIPMFETCRKQHDSSDERIRKDTERGKQLQINATPSFALGIVDKDGRLRVEKIITGAQPFSVFEKSISELLPGQGQVGNFR